MQADLANYDAVIETPVASMKLGIVAKLDKLIAIDLLPACDQTCRPASDIAQEVVMQLQAYFDDPQWQFSLSIAAQGTDFQQRVWQFMTSIPVGETRRYGDVASYLESASRAVGGACRRNPVPIVVPCHRIVAARGIGGYNGCTDGAELNLKQWLLAHERQ